MREKMEGGITKSTKIFVNLPVRDLEQSKAFFAKLGYSFNPQFADERAACMVISEDIYTMLSSEPFFKTFTRKEIADAAKTTEVLVALSAESRGKVDEILLKRLRPVQKKRENLWSTSLCMAGVLKTWMVTFGR